MKKILVTVFLMCFTLLLFSCSNKFENALPDEKKSTAVPSEAQNETQKNDTDLCVMDIPDARQISIELHDNAEYKVNTVMLTQDQDIARIINNLESLTLKRMNYLKPVDLDYMLFFYDADGNKLETVSIVLTNAFTYIGCGHHIHYLKSGELDVAFLESLFADKPETVWDITAEPEQTHT